MSPAQRRALLIALDRAFEDRVDGATRAMGNVDMGGYAGIDGLRAAWGGSPLDPAHVGERKRILDSIESEDEGGRPAIGEPLPSVHRCKVPGCEQRYFGPPVKAEDAPPGWAWLNDGLRCPGHAQDAGVSVLAAICRHERPIGCPHGRRTCCHHCTMSLLPLSLLPEPGKEHYVRQDHVKPIPMLLWCPECGARHIDLGEFATKLHHTHACQGCGHVWRPAIVPTCGVQFLPGFKNEV